MIGSSQQSLFTPTNFWKVFLVVVLLACGFAVRLFDLTDPPLDYASSRQLRSAMIARGRYFSHLTDVPEWQQEIARKQRNSQEMLEPEIIEIITASTYRLAGSEIVWIARIYSSLFWVLGGLALYSLASRLVSEDGGVIALIYYLFVPFGLIASRTFQPDPLMTAAISAAWLAFYRWYDSPNWRRALLAGLAAGFAMFVKSTAIFFLLPGMAVVILSSQKFIEVLKNLQVWLIGLLSALPSLAYFIYGIFIVGVLAGQLKGRFNPQMWADPAFYLGWENAISNVTGHSLLLVLGAAGIFLIKQQRDRRFLLSTWLGYLLFGFIFSYYISTHAYYSLPVIPLLAISLGAIGNWAINWARKYKLDLMIRAGTALLVVLGMGIGYYLFSREDFRHEPPYYSKVASFVDPQDKLVALSQDYGYRLSFYGWRMVQPWKGSGDLRGAEGESFSDQFAAYATGYDYFIVTSIKELKRQGQLFEELYGHYSVLAEESGFVIFDLSRRID